MAVIQVRIGNPECTFRVWRANMGTVFDSRMPSTSKRPAWTSSNPGRFPITCSGAVCDGKHGFFLPRNRVADFWQAHAGVPVIFHNAPFDLKVLAQECPELDVYQRVEDDLIWDTLLLHRLFTLATVGHTASKKGQATLEACVESYLGCTLPKDVKDSQGNDVRLNYGQYLGGDPREIEPVYLEYLAKDALATVLVFDELCDRLMARLESSQPTWGYISSDWLNEQIRRWGPQTHHLQLKAAIVLDAITATGIGVDTAASAELVEKFRRPWQKPRRCSPVRVMRQAKVRARFSRPGLAKRCTSTHNSKSRAP